MPRIVDIRDFSISRIDAARMDTLRQLAASVSPAIAPGLEIVEANTFTGNPSTLRMEPTPYNAEYAAQADAWLSDGQVGQLLGLDAGEMLSMAPVVRRTTSSGAPVIHAAQTVAGIRVYGSGETLRLDPQGPLCLVWSNLVSMTGVPAMEPSVTAADALMVAAGHLAANPALPDIDGLPYGEAPDPAGFTPVVQTAEAGDERVTIFDAGPFLDEISTRMQWFWLPGDIRLAWEVRLATPDRARYSVMVDAHGGAVLRATETTKRVAARGDVFLVDGVEPTRTRKPFPRPAIEYPAPNPAAPSPFDWVDVDRTDGNLAQVIDKDNNVVAAGAIQDGVLTFAFNPPEGVPQQLVNAHYFSCTMHDLAYLLGFHTANGAFEASSAGAAVAASDRVIVEVQLGGPGITPNMDPKNLPGGSPVITLIQWGPNGRHTALDATVVFHEYSHAITSMLVGGGSPGTAVAEPQSKAYDEGTADFFACALTGRDRIGAYSTNNPLGFASRIHLLNADFPDTFANMGTAPYDSDEHSVGAIWCSLLLRVADSMGTDVTLQLVMDGAHLPVNPNFIQARDSIRQALDDQLSFGPIGPVLHTLRRLALLDASAHFGLGLNAQSSGTTLTSLTADTTLFPNDWVNYRFTGIATGLTGLVGVPAGTVNMTAYDGSGLLAFSITDEGRQIDQLAWTPWMAAATSFVPFELGGVHHLLTYARQSGQVAFGRIEADGIMAPTFNGNWTPGWTSFMGFRLGGHPFHLCYNATTGRMNIDRIHDNGQGAQTKLDKQWSTGWTSFAPFEINGETYYIVYKQATGQTDIDHIASDGLSVDNITSATLPAGWTDIRTFVFKGEPHFVAIDAVTRDYKVGSFTLDPATGVIQIGIINEAKRSNQRSTFVHFGDDQAARFVSYDPISGILGTEYYWLP